MPVFVAVVVCSISFFLMAQKNRKPSSSPLIHSGGKDPITFFSIMKYESAVFYRILEGQTVHSKIQTAEVRESAHHYPSAAVEECGNCNLLQRRKNEGTTEASERASERAKQRQRLFLLFFRRCRRRRRRGRRRRRDDRFWQSVSETTIPSIPLLN